MPQFSWVGVRITGDIAVGTTVALDEKHLDYLLNMQEIALLSCKIKKKLFKSKKINIRLYAQMFYDLSQLLQSGVPINQALFIQSQQSDNSLIQELLYELKYDIDRGLSFTQSLQRHIKNSSIIPLLNAGQETASLAQVLVITYEYLHTIIRIRTNVKKLLFMPLVTISFFFLVSGFMLFIIIPQLFSLVQSSQPTIPSSLQQLHTISIGVKTHWTLLLSIILFVSLGAYLFFKRNKKSLWRIPFLGSWIKDWYAVSMLYSLGTLCKGGMPLVKAVEITSHTQHAGIVHYCLTIKEALHQGYTFASANASIHPRLFDNQTIAFLSFAQENGQISHMLVKAGQLKLERFEKKLQDIIRIAQPILLLVLGLLILCLLAAMYNCLLAISASNPW